MGTQVSVSLNAPVALVGMLADNDEVTDILSATAAVDIPFGSYVELTLSATGTGFVANRPVYGGSTLGKGGIALRENAKVPASGLAGLTTAFGVHEAGKPFPVLVKGRCFALVDSGMTSDSTLYLETAKVKCASTAVTDQGSLTTNAASAVDNSEIVDTVSTGTTVKFVRASDKANSIGLVQVG